MLKHFGGKLIYLTMENATTKKFYLLFKYELIAPSSQYVVVMSTLSLISPATKIKFVDAEIPKRMINQTD